jgi:anti-sigma regulatory factor (Ser/Thr protein kinase)
LARSLLNTKDMAQKFQIEFEDMDQTQTFAVLSGTSGSRPFVELQQLLPSQVDAIEPFVARVKRFISKFRNLDGSEPHIEMAVREALLKCCNSRQPRGSHKRVHVICRCSKDGEVSITIRDQGQGFDCRTLEDPTTPENLLSTRGRGIYLMQALMDEVCFDEGGTAVRMRKKPAQRRPQ